MRLTSYCCCDCSLTSSSSLSLFLLLLWAGTCAVLLAKLYGLSLLGGPDLTTYVHVCVCVYVVCTQASLSFTSATGNSIGLAKIVVYMPICLFDLCKMCVRRWVNPLPPTLTHTPVHTHSSHSHTGTHDVRLEIWPNNPTNVRISRHSKSIRPSVRLLVRPFCPARSWPSLCIKRY